MHRLVLALSLIAAAPLAAQAGSVHPTAAVAAEKWVGTWEGTFMSDGPSGGMKLVISKTGDTWKVEASTDSGMESGPVTDVVVTDAGISYRQTAGSFDVLIKATLEGETMKGTMEASSGGTVVGGGSFTLTRKG